MENKTCKQGQCDKIVLLYKHNDPAQPRHHLEDAAELSCEELFVDLRRHGATMEAHGLNRTKQWYLVFCVILPFAHLQWQ